jgi:hypothetical protein
MCVTLVAIVFLCSTAATSLPPVTFESPCECHDKHGEHRWAVKNDPSTPPADASAIQTVKPSDICSWPGPDVPLTKSSERTGIETKWYALTDRDLHIALSDATGDKPGIVVCELPSKQHWCEVRNTVFGWTRMRFPFHTSSAKKLTLNQNPVVAVTGKAFFDFSHSVKDQKLNRRSHLPGYAVW